MDLYMHEEKREGIKKQKRNKKEMKNKWVKNIKDKQKLVNNNE